MRTRVARTDFAAADIGLSEQVVRQLLLEVKARWADRDERDKFAYENGCSCCGEGESEKDPPMYTGVIFRLTPFETGSRTLREVVGRRLGDSTFSDDKWILVADEFFGSGLSDDKRQALGKLLKEKGCEYVFAVSYSHGMAELLARKGLNALVINRQSYQELWSGVVRLALTKNPHTPLLVLHYFNPAKPYYARCLFPVID